MKIYITGIAKSGTTLLARLFYTFGLPIHVEEIRLIDLCKSEETTLVGKRTEYTLFSNILNRADLSKQIDCIKYYDIKIINIYRNGVDVLESFERDWGYWNPLIWCEGIRQMLVYPELLTCNIQYERLIEEPDVIQKEIADKLGLNILCKFSDYPDYLPEGIFPTEVERYKPRSISNASIGKKFNINKPGIDIDYFNEQMKFLGYDTV